MNTITYNMLADKLRTCAEDATVDVRFPAIVKAIADHIDGEEELDLEGCWEQALHNRIREYCEVEHYNHHIVKLVLDLPLDEPLKINPLFPFVELIETALDFHGHTECNNLFCLVESYCNYIATYDSFNFLCDYISTITK